MTSDQHNLDLLNPIIKEDPMTEDNQFLSQSPSEDSSSYTAPPSRPKQRHIYESPEAKARRLGKLISDFQHVCQINEKRQNCENGRNLKIVCSSTAC